MTGWPTRGSRAVPRAREDLKSDDVSRSFGEGAMPFTVSFAAGGAAAKFYAEFGFDAIGGPLPERYI